MMTEMMKCFYSGESEMMNHLTALKMKLKTRVAGGPASSSWNDSGFERRD